MPKPRSFTRLAFRFDKHTGQPVRPHLYVKRLGPREYVGWSLAAHQLFSKFPDDARLRDGVQAVREILEPGPEPVPKFRGKGAMDIRLSLFPELQRLRLPKPYLTKPTAKAKPMRPYEAVLVACGVWLRVWSDDRKFSTGNDLTREMGRNILARRPYRIAGRVWSEKLHRVVNVPKPPSMRVCSHLGSQIRTALLPLLAWVKDECFTLRPRRQMGRRKDEASTEKLARERRRRRALVAFNWTVENSTLAKAFAENAHRKFNSTSAPTPRERTQRKKSMSIRPPNREDVQVTVRSERVASEDGLTNADVDALYLGQSPTKPTAGVNYIRPSAAIAAALDSATDQPADESQDTTDEPTDAELAETGFDLLTSLGRVRAREAALQHRRQGHVREARR